MKATTSLLFLVTPFTLLVAQSQDSNRPAIFFTDVTAGPVTGGPNGLGTPIGIFGKGFGATQGSSKVTIGGVEVARYLTWGRQNAVNGLLDMVVVQPGPDLVSGAIEVTVGGIKSTGLAGFQRTDGRIYSIAIGLGLGGVLGSGPVSNAVERPRREGARGRRGLAPRR